MTCSVECGKAWRLRNHQSTAIVVPCSNCGKEVVKRASVAAKSKSGKLYCDKSCQDADSLCRKKSCIDCRAPITAYSLRCKVCAGINKSISNYMTFHDKTIGEVVNGTASKYWHLRFEPIRRWSLKIAKAKFPDGLYCLRCGYNKPIIEVAHRKGLTEFSVDTKISIVNDTSNLAPLCPNHHGELDAGLIKPDEIPSIEDIVSPG